MNKSNEIILYQPDEFIKLEVRLENETVWLTQAQMVDLFQTSKQNISLHTNNIFTEKELDKNSVVKEYLTTASDGKSYRTKYYNLDVIISVGYRVKSIRGTQFRQWANNVLREYLLRGYAVNQRFLQLENRIDRHLTKHDNQIRELSGKVDFFLRTSLPPKEGILFDGQIFDAYVFVCQLVKIAKKRIVLIDNYIDESVLTLLDKRKQDVSATIYTKHIDHRLQLDIEKHNDQYTPITIRQTPRCHDRFMIIDDSLYHIGASIKDLGLKLFAFSKMGTSPETLLDSI